MKKYLFMLTAALFAAVSYAMIAAGDREERVPDSQSQALPNATSVKSLGVKQGQVASSSLFGARKVQGNHEDMITEVPTTAEVKYYNRSGYYHDSDNNYAAAEQSGITAIAFDGNDVYIQNPIAGFESGLWVKGTIDGETITVPLGQFLTWSASNSYGLYLTMVDVDGSDYTNDTEATVITYTISGDVITQNGTSATRTLAVAWSDDDTVYAYGAPGGEYETVFTLSSEYVPTPTVLVELPNGATVEQWYVQGTDNGEEANVAFVGDDVYISGIFGEFPDSWIKGTISGSTVTFEKLQYLGDYGSYHIWATAANVTSGELEDIVMTYDAEAGTLTLDASQVLLANASDTKVYYLSRFTSLKLMKEAPQAFEYNMTYINPSSGEEASKPINVAVVGNEVYFQGMSQYLPEAWVKGTMEGNQVTFAANQLMGTYGSYGESYFFYNGETVFTYDADADTYSATGVIYGVLADQYYDGRYQNPVLTKVNEVAGVPATPTISGIEGTTNGDVVDFNIPTVDVNGNAMATGKLSYQFFVDNEDTPLEFTTEYFTKLTANMTVIPYGFTDNYDFYATYIYLNMPHDTWKRLGIQSIYTGGGVENKSEIFWFEMPAGPVEAPDNLVTETYIFKANALEYSSSGGIEHPDYTIQVQVGFDGDDAYIQGLAKDMPELWVKATKNEQGQYVIPANQYMGDLVFWGYTFPYYWTALDAENNLVDAVLDYDAETSTFSTEQTLALNGAANALDYYLLFNDVTLTKFVEVAATPAKPAFENFILSDEVGYTKIYASVPAVDTEGNALNTSKLFYKVWYEKDGQQYPYTFTAALYDQDFDEDVTEVPYSHDGYDIYSGGEIIYLEDEPEELQSWTRAGIQSIYYGAGERKESSIAWGYCTSTLMKGDPNGDCEVTTSDAVLAVNFALEVETPTEEQFAAADYNNSNDITVSDAVGIANEALGRNSVEEGSAPARMLLGDNYLKWNDQQLMLVNSTAFVGFQMDVTLDNGAVLNGVKLSERAAGLSVRYNRVSENTWRIIAMSLQNKTISGNEGDLLKFDISGNSNINVNNIEFTDGAARAYTLGFNGEATGINSMSIDSANGDVYNVNGVRTNTMRKGMNIIRNANGEVNKVLVK